jgi:hypothetical protein
MTHRLFLIDEDSGAIPLESECMAAEKEFTARIMKDRGAIFEFITTRTNDT